MDLGRERGSLSGKCHSGMTSDKNLEVGNTLIDGAVKP